MAIPRIRPFAAGPSALYFWLMVTAFLLIVSGSTIKNSLASFVVDTTYAPFYSLNHGLRKLVSVYEENRELARINAELTANNARLREAGRENARLRRMLNFKSRGEFSVVPAEVVGSPSVPVKGTVWISVNPGDSIRVGSPVITPTGLVGNVAGGSGKLTIVRSLWDQDCRVAAVDQRSRAAGIVRWVAGPHLTFSYVPVDGDVKVGDTIISSGWGERYPEGLPIGEVYSATLDSAAFFLAVTIKPFVRFETLEEVFVIQSIEPTVAEEEIR